MIDEEPKEKKHNFEHKYIFGYKNGNLVFSAPRDGDPNIHPPQHQIKVSKKNGPSKKV